MGPCADLSTGLCWESAVPEIAAAACPGLLFSWAVGDGDMGLFRIVLAAPGLEQRGGEARGGGKGDVVEGLGWRDGCRTGGIGF